MKAYTRTLEKAVNSKYEKSDFRCYSEYPSKFSLNCVDCPFECSSDNCTDPYFNLFTKELEEKAKAKYEVEYTTLDSDKPRKEYVRKVVDLLSIIKEWNKEAIEWNLIANGNTSKIPPDFKDIYIKVYDPEEGVILFQDGCTLKSKGLKLAWIKDD